MKCSGIITIRNALSTFQRLILKRKMQKGNSKWSILLSSYSKYSYSPIPFEHRTRDSSCKYTSANTTHNSIAIFPHLSNSIVFQAKKERDRGKATEAHFSYFSLVASHHERLEPSFSRVSLRPATANIRIAGEIVGRERVSAYAPRSFERHVTINEQMAGSLPVIVIIVERPRGFLLPTPSSRSPFPSPSMKENERGETRHVSQWESNCITHADRRRRRRRRRGIGETFRAPFLHCFPALSKYGGEESRFRFLGHCH